MSYTPPNRYWLKTKHGWASREPTKEGKLQRARTVAKYNKTH